MAKVNRVGRSFSTLPFDGIDNVQNLWIHDDFIGSIDVADIGTGTVVHTAQGVWNAGEVGTLTGPGTVTQLVSEAGHPGILALQTADDAEEEVALLLGAAAETEADDDFILDSNGLYVASILRIPDLDGQKVSFGLMGDIASPNAGTANQVVFVHDPDDDAAGDDDNLLIAQVNGASNTDEEAFTLPIVESDWLQLELFATSSDAYFRLTTEDGVETINLTVTMPTVGVRPGFVVEAEGSAVEQIDIDAFHLRYGRPEEAANAGKSYLGQ